MMTAQKTQITILLATLFYCTALLAQPIDNPFQPIITEMGELEGNKDAKCHATAARLENFIYGTPLTAEARQARIDFQQELVRSIWQTYTEWLKGEGNSLVLFQSAVAQHFTFQRTTDGSMLVETKGGTFKIVARDLRQYSSVAYAYRAILAVQQSCAFSDTDLVPLSPEVINYFKEVVDVAVLTLLGKADAIARANNEYTLNKAHLEQASDWFQIPATSTMTPPSQVPVETLVSTLIYPTIEKKLAAYQAYNNINQAVFLRNIQVYFARVPWPTDATASNQLKNHFTQLMVQFAAETLLASAALAAQDQQTTIDYSHAHTAVQSYLPFAVNNFEDVTYFPNLSRDQRIQIESYDLDAFRDSGLHWQYLKFAFDDQGASLPALPDPFALEMLVEGIAQFAVLIFRLAGEEATEAAHLQPTHINAALQAFQQLLVLSEQAGQTTVGSATIQSATAASTATAFTEMSTELGIDYIHRTADWLSRLIRSYVVKEDEQLARLAVPPAFGGGGVAAADVNGDGWEDVLFVGGLGNRLFLNREGTYFEDVTESTGVNWLRSDGNPGEPRQPIIADFDNDGLQDIFISYANDAHRLYRNIGGAKFEDVTAQAQLGGEELVGGPATAIDIDNDGFLDLYIGYFGNYPKGILPTLKRHNTNASPNQLFRNLGGCKFENISAGSGVENIGWTQAAGHADINGDGWQDLIAGNDFGVNAYYLNQQDGTFEDVSRRLGTDKPSYTMNVGVGDINGDLRPDFYISNIVVMEKDDKYVLPSEDTQAHFDPSSLSTMRVVEANDLFLSGKTGYELSQNVGRGYSATGWSWDADFFDFDNDTDLDLYCLTGMNPFSVYGQENEYYTTPDGANKEITLATSNEEANIFFENQAGQLLVNTNSGLDYSGTSRSAAYLDFDHDGDLDIVTNEYHETARFFRNESENTNHWLALRLQHEEPNMNRDAIGAQVIVTLPDGRKLWQELHSTTGYLSAHPKTLHFGLGKANTAQVEIIWPNGHRQQRTDMPVDQRHSIRYR